MDVFSEMCDAEVRALDLIERTLPDVLQRLVNVAQQVTGASEARLNIITSTSQHTLFSSRGGRSEADVNESLCARVIRQEPIAVTVPDARLDPRFADSEFVTSGAVASYAANQLVTTKGVPIGTLCVFDPEPREVSAESMAIVSELSTAVMDVLESRRQQAEMADSIVELTSGSRELRRSNEHLAAFAGQVSHDVQGPLAAVLMALQMIEDGEAEPGSEGHRMLLDAALSGAQRMRATVTGLMEFAKVGGSLRAECVDLASTVSDVLADLSARAGRSRVVVGDLPKVHADPVQLRALLQNLVANAMKYAGHVADPVIRIEGHALTDRTVVTVSDNGPGVPAADREEVFGLLARGDLEEHAGVDGLGIGLATCRRIVEVHQGAIGVRDSAEDGAEFWFELPLP